MNIRTAALAAAGLAGFAFVAPAAAQEDGLMVRARMTYLKMDTSSSAGALPRNAIDVDNKWIPEVDVSWFFNRNVAVELVLTVPQKHDVSVSGSKIGTFKHLPPTLLGQWHFDPINDFKPYVGAGINYTRIGSEKMSVGGTPVTLDNSSFGPALQLGVDYRLNGPWYLNADLKKVWIKSDVHLGGARISEVKLNPYLLSFGVGYRF